MRSGVKITEISSTEIGAAEINAKVILNPLFMLSFALEVIFSEPTVITHPPANLTYQVGWPYLNIFCGASYDKRLDLRIEWYKGGVQLMKFTDQIYLEGRASGPPRILFINDVTVADRGNYSCHAYTKIGDVISEDWAHGWLRIKGIP